MEFPSENDFLEEFGIEPIEVDQDSAAGVRTRARTCTRSLLANMLGGMGDHARNLVTLFQRNANHPNMSSFERQVRSAVQAGETVNYRATPIYSGNNLMPTGVMLTARGSSGSNLDVSIPNINGVM